MKILILGFKGNLGSQLMKIFSEDNKVIGWEKNDVDITDKELVFKKINDLKPDVVINASAYNAVDKCEESNEEYELAKKINIDGPKFLAEVALSVGAILIHYSTDYVFSGNKEDDYYEDDLPDPINRYGKTKADGEKKIIELSSKGLKWYLIRTSKLFGPKGESEMAKPSFFDIMLKLSQDPSYAKATEGEEKKELNVVDGEKSCFTYIPDLALATKNLLESNKDYGIYHLTNSGSCTWYEGVIELFKLKNINIKVNRINSDGLKRPAKRPQNSTLLNTKLGLLRSWQEALAEYLKITEENKIKIAGVVTLYNPTKNIINNIDLYINDLEILFVVDNSDKKEIEILNILKSKEKIYYIDNQWNKGIANALNVGAIKAIKKGYDWLLTLDQDSKVTSGMIALLVESLKFYDLKTIGIVAPIHKNKFGKYSEKILEKKEISSKILTTMMSGNLLNLNVYKKVGPFLEKLFIDSVDNEYCLRLNKNGFLVIQANEAILEHNLGNQKNFFFFFTTNHSPLRRYYITRNRLFVNHLYKKDFPAFCKSENRRFYKDLIKILIGEDKKILKIKAIIQGYKDYCNGIFGKKFII